MAWDVTGQSWTAAELVSDVRRVASLPQSSTDFPDSVVLREATDVLWSFAGWAMQQAGDGRLVELLQRPVTGLLASDYRTGSEVELPPLAVADTVEGVSWLNAEGSSEVRLQRIDHHAQSTYDNPTSTGQPIAYALLGNRLRLYPKPDQGGTIRLTYQRRHPVLVPDQLAYAATLLNVATTVAGTITRFQYMGDQPLAGLQPLDNVDLLSNQAPYRPLVTGVPVWAANGTTNVDLNVPLSMLSGLNLYGVRLVRTGHSPYVHYPLELRAAVAEKTAANIMRRFGDLTNAQASEQTAQQELARVMQMLSPRAKRDRVRAVNPYSHLRLGMRRGWLPR